MKTKTLYRFEREDGGITHSLEKPSVPYTERIRLIADEGKAITKDGVKLYSCKDEDIIEDEGTIEEMIAATVALWHEVDAPAEWRVRE